MSVDYRDALLEHLDRDTTSIVLQYLEPRYTAVKQYVQDFLRLNLILPQREWVLAIIERLECLDPSVYEITGMARVGKTKAMVVLCVALLESNTHGPCHVAFHEAAERMLGFTLGSVLLNLKNRDNVKQLGRYCIVSKINGSTITFSPYAVKGKLDLAIFDQFATYPPSEAENSKVTVVISRTE